MRSFKFVLFLVGLAAHVTATYPKPPELQSSPARLVNEGSSSYINSAMQFLFSVAPFVRTLLSQKHLASDRPEKFTKELADNFYAMLTHSPGQNLQISGDMLKHLSQLGFLATAQSDCAELLGLIMGSLDPSLADLFLISAKNQREETYTTFIKELAPCSGDMDNPQPLSDLSAALDLLWMERLSVDRASIVYQSEKINAFEQLSSALVFRISRFREMTAWGVADGSNRRVPEDRPFDPTIDRRQMAVYKGNFQLPEQVDLAPYLPEDTFSTLYLLAAVICYSGDYGKGFYYSLVLHRPSDTWYRCINENVGSVRVQEALTLAEQEGYMAVYYRSSDDVIFANSIRASGIHPSFWNGDEHHFVPELFPIPETTAPGGPPQIRVLPPSLANEGASCYVNSLMQILFAATPFLHRLLTIDVNYVTGDTDAAKQLAKTFYFMLTLPENKKLHIKNLIFKFLEGQGFSSKAQGDSTEVFNAITGAISTDFLEYFQIITEDYRFVAEPELTEEVFPYVGEITNPTPVDDLRHTLDSVWVNRTRVGLGDNYFGEHFFSVKSTSSILAFTINRFGTAIKWGDSDGSHKREPEGRNFDPALDKRETIKYFGTFHLPLDLELKDYLPESTPGTHYRMLSVLLHQGDYGGGHFSAFVNHLATATWYLCDDYRIEPVKETEVLRRAATDGYMVMYYRVGDEALFTTGIKQHDLHPSIWGLAPPAGAFENK